MDSAHLMGDSVRDAHERMQWRVVGSLPLGWTEWVLTQPALAKGKAVGSRPVSGLPSIGEVGAMKL